MQVVFKKIAQKIIFAQPAGACCQALAELALSSKEIDDLYGYPERDEDSMIENGKLRVENCENSNFGKVYENIKNTLNAARAKAYSFVNFYMVQAYWNIGRLIVEAQGGKERAEYGEQFIKNLSNELTREFGKGFTATNLKTMRKFYFSFKNSHALRDQLSWTHYRLIIRIDDEKKRNFYIDECIKSNWSTRQLERQINSFYL